MMEKRHSERQDVFFIVEYTSASSGMFYSTGITKNVSYTGFCFESQCHPHRPGEPLRFRLKHPKTDLYVNAAGKIIWKKESEFECVTGVRLDEIRNGGGSTISALMSSVMTAHAAAPSYPAAAPSYEGHEEWPPPAAGRSTEMILPSVIESSVNLAGSSDHAEMDKVPEAPVPASPVITGEKAPLNNIGSDRKANRRSASYRKQGRKLNYVIPAVLLAVIAAATVSVKLKNRPDIKPIPVTTSLFQQQPVKGQPFPLPENGLINDQSSPAVAPIPPAQSLQIPAETAQQAVQKPSPPEAVADVKENIALAAGRAPLRSMPENAKVVTTDSKPDDTRPVVQPTAASDKKEVSPSTPAVPAFNQVIAKKDIEDPGSSETQPPFEKQGWKTYEENFSNNSNNWDIFNTYSASAQIMNGEYRIENKRHEGTHVILHYHDFPHKPDFTMESLIRLVKGVDDHYYGLVFGASDGLNSIVFEIAPNSSYQIRKIVRGRSQELASGRLSADTVDKNSANALKIVKRDSTIRFYVNNNFASEISGLTFFGEKTGFIVEGDITVAVEKTSSRIPAEDTP